MTQSPGVWYHLYAMMMMNETIHVEQAYESFRNDEVAIIVI